MITDLQISRVLDLSCSDDQKELLKALAHLPEIRTLVEDHLDAYLGLFPEDDWHLIHSGGLIGIPTHEKGSVMLDLREALLLASALEELRLYPGYQRFLSQFRNPSQVKATIFETRVAKWCKDRDTFAGLQFAPEVFVGRDVKRPDFLWRTQLGDLYCECKSGRFFETNLRQKIKSTFAILKQLYEESAPWDPMFRLEISLASTRTNKIQDQFTGAVQEAQREDRRGAQDGWHLHLSNVQARFMRREAPFKQDSETIVMGLAQVDPTPRSVVEASYLSLAMPVGGFWHRWIKRMLVEARRQLPPDSQGAIFIEFNAEKTVRAKLQGLVSQLSYARTPWVSLWQQGEFRFAIWRDGQPFDARLLLPGIQTTR